MADTEAPEGASKAVSDLASAAKKIADAVEDAGNFIGRIVGPPAEQLSSLLSDQLRFWKARNLNRIANKYDELTRERGWHPDAIRVLPFGVSVQAIEKAAVEEDETLQTMWAQLFANATDPKKNISITKVHTDLLSSLTGIDAHILQLKWDWMAHSRGLAEMRGGLTQDVQNFNDRVTRRNKYIDDKYELFVAQLSRRELGISLHNLLRLQILEKFSRSFDDIRRPSWAIGSIGSLSNDVGPDTYELGRILDELADVSRVIDVGETVDAFYEVREGIARTSTNLCQSVLDHFNFTSLGTDLMQSVE